MPEISPRRWWALGAIVLSVLTVGFDTTILNVALSTLATDLHATGSDLQWMVDAYVLVLAGVLLPGGALGDRYGRRKLLMIGLILFGLGSLAASFCANAGQLIGIRAVMGVGAAILTPITISVIPVMFPARERARAISVATMAMGLGVPLGPLVGGYLLRHFWWGSIFLVNVPVVLVALVAVAFLMPESRDPSARRVDLVGGALSTVGLMLTVYGIIEAPDRGWTDPVVVGALVLGVAVLVAFAWWQRHAANPVMDLELFHNRRFLWGSVAATLATFALFGLLFVLPQYLQVVRGNDALGTGLRLLPMMGGLVLGARLAEGFVSAVGNRVPVALGLVVVAGGLAWGGTTGTDTGFGTVAGWLVVLGSGVGLSLTPAMHAVLTAFPEARAGASTAVSMTMRQVGGALGVAILGSVLANSYRDRLPASAPGPARDSVAAAAALARQLGDPGLLLAGRVAYVHAMDVVLLVCAGVALLSAALGAAFLPARGPDTPAATEPTTRRQPPDEEQSQHEYAGLA